MKHTMKKIALYSLVALTAAQPAFAGGLLPTYGPFTNIPLYSTPPAPTNPAPTTSPSTPATTPGNSGGLIGCRILAKASLNISAATPQAAVRNIIIGYASTLLPSVPSNKICVLGIYTDHVENMGFDYRNMPCLAQQTGRGCYWQNAFIGELGS